MNLLSRLLPADTRSVEFTSALSFLFLAISSFLSPKDAFEFASFNYWFAFFLLFALQTLGIICSLLTALRIILAYVSGIIWFWIGASMFAVENEMFHCASVAVALAFSNFYAFVIGIAHLIKKKKEQETGTNG